MLPLEREAQYIFCRLLEAELHFQRHFDNLRVSLS
jgi:hypothetical protein